jgi:hypothetical protein
MGFLKSRILASGGSVVVVWRWPEGWGVADIAEGPTRGELRRYTENAHSKRRRFLGLR